MIKNNKLKITVASVLILLPTILGAIFWDKLPDVFPTHWGIDGKADGFGGKVLFVIVMPLIFYALFWVMLLVTAKGKSNRDQNKKILGMTIWIIPYISVFVSLMSYFGATGNALEMTSFIPVIIGILFAVLGNYMPKCRQNRTIGVKTKWTLENEENWNRTHRFAGKAFVIGGLLTVLCVFLPNLWGMGVALALVFMSCLSVYIYSYCYYKKQKREGTYVVDSKVEPMKKGAKIVTAILVVAILVGVAVLMFTGDIEVVIDGETFTVDSTYYGETTFALDDIQTVQYVESFDGGLRTSGFASARLELGNFENEKYKYLSYRYTSVDACVVLFTKHGIIAVNRPTEEETVALYEELLEKTVKDE